MELRKEIGRKGIHLFSLLFVVVYFLFAYFIGHRVALFVLTFLLVVMIEIEYFIGLNSKPYL